MWRLRQIRRRLARLISWFPIIWRDEDYDHSFLYRIMAFKISRMANDIERVDRHVGCEEVVATMRIVEALLTKQADGDYPIYTNSLCTCSKEEHETYTRITTCDNCIKNCKDKLLNEEADYVRMWDLMKEHSRKWWD